MAFVSSDYQKPFKINIYGIGANFKIESKVQESV
jgi:hypothetical protein